MPEKTSPLRFLFEPRAVAVLGASRDPKAIGHRVVTALLGSGFPRPIYPVNPKADTIAGLTAFPSLRATPRPVDLAVIAAPAPVVLPLIDDCASAGVKAIVCITAGFAETGAEGAARQKEIVDKVRGHGMRLVGPNCFGVLNTDPQAPLNASFSSLFPPAGGVALASQSGGLGLALLGNARDLSLGVSQFVSLGNKADLSSNDLLEYWELDERTRIILLYLESFGNPGRFLEICRRVSRKKPIVVLKSGRSSAGSRAAGSHTAALTSSDGTIDALLHQSGAIRVQTLEEMFQSASGLALQPPMQGNRLALVTNAGGPAILCTDAAEERGLRVEAPSDALREALRSVLPDGVSPGNPLDLVASAGPEHFAKTIPVLLAASETEGLIILYTEIEADFSPPIRQAIAEGIATARRGAGKSKPIVICWMGEAPHHEPFRVGEEEIPVFRFPEDAARTMASLAAWHRIRSRPAEVRTAVQADDEERMRSILVAAAKSADRWLAADQTLAALRAAGFSAPGIAASNEEQAMAAAESLGYPVALKLASRVVTHKTEVGGVQLGLRDAASVRTAYAKIEASLRKARPGERVEAVVVQPMITQGVEVFVGMQRDPVFGPVIAFGLGGIHVEILSDVGFRVAPLSTRDAREMIREIRGYRLLTGFRGAPAADVDALERVVLRAAIFAEKNPEIVSFDFNPVIARPKGEGCVVLDARLELAPR